MSKQIIGKAGERNIYGKAWQGKRIYISVEGVDADFGYYDLIAGEYVAGKRDIERWFSVGVVDFAALAQQL